MDYNATERIMVTEDNARMDSRGVQRDCARQIDGGQREWGVKVTDVIAG